MKKLFKKLALILPGLLLIVSVFAFIGIDRQNNSNENNDNIPKTEDINQSVSGWNGSLSIVYSKDQWLEADGSNAITKLNGLTEFYIGFYVNVTSGLKAYEINYDIDLGQVSSIEWPDQTQNKMNDVMSLVNFFGGYSGPHTGDMFSGNLDYGSKIASGFQTANFSYNATEKKIIIVGSAGSSTVGAGRYCIGKAKVTLKPGQVFSAKNSKVVISGSDGNITKMSGDSALDTELGLGALSTNTDITGTIKGQTETSAKNYSSTSGTAVNLTVPAAVGSSNNATLTIQVADDGTVDSFTGSNISGSNGTYTLAFSSRGQTITGTANVTAQDGKTTQSYTINVKWEQFDEKRLTGITISQTSGTYTPKYTFTAGSNDATAISTPVSIASSTPSVTITPQFDNNKGISVTVNGQAFTGSAITVSVSNGTSVPVIVRAEDGTTKQYNYNFTVLTSDTTLSGVSLKNGNNQSLGNATYNTVTGQWEISIPYSTNNNPNNIVNVTATPTKNGNTVSYSPTQLTFNSTQQQTQTMKITVTDKDTGEKSEITLVVTREFGDTDAGLDIKVYGTGGAASESQLTETGSSKPDNKEYSIKLSDYPKVRFEFTATSTAPTPPLVEFSENNSTWKEWTGSVASSSYTVPTAGTQYYVRVTPSAGTSARKVYTIHLKPVDERDTDPTLKELYITYVDADGNTQTPTEKSNQVFDKTKPGAYTYVVPYNAGEITIHYSQNSARGKGVYRSMSATSGNMGVATLSTSSITAGSSKQLTYYGYADNETWSGMYTLTIQREQGSSNAYLNDLKLNGATVTGFSSSDVDKIYTVIVARGRADGSKIAFSYTPCAYANATHSGGTGITGNADGTLSASGQMTFTKGHATTTITVTSQDGAVVHTYEIHVYSADEGHDLSNIEILNYDQSGITMSGDKEIATSPTPQLDADSNILYTEGANPANNPVNLTVPYSVDKVFFNVTSNSPYAKITGHGTKNLIAGQVNTVKVFVTSEYGTMNPSAADTKSVEIIFYIKREAADTENRLKTFDAVTNGTTSTTANITFNQNQSAIAVADVDPTATSLTVTVTKQSSKSTVSINGDTNDALTLTIPITWPSAQTGTVTFTIIVTAEDKSPRTYNVTVSREAIKLNNNNSIDNIRVEGSIPSQSPVDYSPANMLPASFPHNKTIDGHVSTITVTVTTPTGVGSTVNYEYSIPGGTTQTSSGSTLTISNVPTGTTKIIVYATAEDGTEGKRYEINLTKPVLSNDATLTSVDVNGTLKTNPSPNTPLEYFLPSGTTNAPITITPNHAGAKISVSGTTVTQNPTTGVATGTLNLKKGANNITITVTPEDGSAATNYQVEVWVEEETTLENLSVTDHTITPNFAPNNTTYQLTIPYTENSLEVVYTLPASVDPKLVDVTIAGFAPTNGRYTVNVPKSMSIDVVVKQKNSDPNGGKTTYTINVTKLAASSDNLLLDVNVDGSPIDGFSPTTNDYVILLPYGTNSITFSGIEVSTGASYTPTSSTPGSFTTSLKNGTNKKQIAVTSEAGGAPNIYNFYIIVADTDMEIINIEILDASGKPILDVDGNPFIFNANDPNPADFVVPNTVTTANIKVTKSNARSVIYMNSKEYKHNVLTETILENLTQMGSTNPNKFDINAISQFLWELNADTTILPRPSQSEIDDNTSPTYSINIVRANLDNDATLKELHVFINGEDRILNFNPLTEKYEVENVGNTGSVTIQAIPNKKTSTVLTIKDKTPDASGSATIVLGDTANAGYLIPVTILVQAEDGTTKPYEVTLARGPIDVNQDNSIVNIRVFDSNQKEYLTFDAGKQTFDVNIPVGVKDYTIYVEGINGSVAKIYINSAQLNILPESVDASDWGTTKTYVVYAESGNGVKGTEYTINVNIAEPDSDMDLIYLEVNGEVLVTGSGDGTGPFEIRVPYEVDRVDLIAKSSSEKANIRVNNGNPTLHEFTGEQLLSEGYNSIYVEVTAEDGISKKLYQVYVIRAPKEPELLTLGVNGEKLLDMDGFGVQFDPKVKEYKVNVIYTTEIADIFATSSEPSDTITGTGAKTLLVGENVCVVTITSAAGVSTEYTLYIRRYSASSANADAARAWIEEIGQFEKDFSPLQTIGYEYTVPNGIDNLNVHFEAEENKPTSDGLPAASVAYYGDKNLRPGLNNVVVVITAPDGITSKVYVINVTKEAMQYEVSNEKYTDFTIEDISTSTDPNNYKVNIGNVKSVDVNFEDLIKNLAEDPDNNPLTVTVLSDVKSNPSEVILSVSDGEVTEIVKLTIESTGNPSTVDAAGLWPLYLILGLILLILIFILICVNRDKFGKIAKKTHDKTDKKNKKEDQQQGA